MTERYRSPDERAAGSRPQPQLTYRGPIPGTTEVLLIRHGRSADVVPGTPESSDPGLHEIGRAQAHALAKRLESKQIDGVYASHLARAIETARPTRRRASALPVNVIEDLQEVLLGDWGEGEFRRRAAIGDPEFLAAMATGRRDAIPGARARRGLACTRHDDRARAAHRTCRSNHRRGVSRRRDQRLPRRAARDRPFAHRGDREHEHHDGPPA